MYASFAESSDVQRGHADRPAHRGVGDGGPGGREPGPGGDRAAGRARARRQHRRDRALHRRPRRAAQHGAGVGARGGRVAPVLDGRRRRPRARRCWRSRPPIRRAPSRSRGRSASASRGPAPGCWCGSIGSWSAGRAGRRGRAAGPKTRRVSDSADVTVPSDRRVTLSRRRSCTVCQRATRCPRRHRARDERRRRLRARWRGNAPGHPALDLDFSHRSRDKGESRVDHVLRRGRRPATSGTYPSGTTSPRTCATSTRPTSWR